MATLVRYGTLLIIILFAAWFGHDPSYEPAIGFFVTLGGYIAPDIIHFIHQRHSTSVAKLQKTGEVCFDYLPEKPTIHGWRLGLEGNEQLEPLFSCAVNCPTSSGIQIQSRSRYHMEYNVQPAEYVTDVIHVSLKLTSARDSTFYLRLSVETKDGTKEKRVWIAHKIGREKPFKQNDGEWRIAVAGEPHDHGWVTVQLKLREEVAATFGTEGWRLRSLIGFRVRDSISMSPITMFRCRNVSNGDG